MTETRNIFPWSTPTTVGSRNYLYRHIFVEVVSVLLILLFGLTALDKAIHFERFYTELGKSPFLMAYRGWVAGGTPLVEAAVAALLIAGGRWKQWGLYASVFLMSLFTGYVYLLLNYSYYTPCLCSAALESLSWEQHLVFNAGFLALAIAATLLNEKQQTRHQNHLS